MKSKINLSEIFKKHFSTLKNENGVFIREDKIIFFLYPVLISFGLIIIVRIPDTDLINLFTLSLSVFIGLFLNILVLLISFIENKLNVSDSKNRNQLLKETFYNITYTIVICLIGLGVLFFANIDDFSNCSGFNFHLKKFDIYGYISIYVVYQYFIYFIFYIIFVHIILTLLMIIKRIFKFFMVEINNN